MFAQRIARSHRQSGFTLIELLVVIVILGLLAAVVVFAVRGSGNQGRQAAIDTDKRILRTAMEAYCAQKDHYPIPDEAVPERRTVEKVLVADKFLSSESDLHELKTGGTEGNCGGEHYSIDPIDPLLPIDPKCGQVGGWCGAPEIVARTADRATPTPLLSLHSGKVLAAIDDRGLQLYDPAVGGWGPLLTYPTNPPLVNTISQGAPWVSIGPGPHGIADCDPLCGKVFINILFGGWFLFDPDVGSSGVWLPASVGSSDPGASNGQHPISAEQIIAGNCDPLCGQVLIAYPGAFHPGPPPSLDPAHAELYDPKTGLFTSLGELPGPVYGTPTIVALGDGRVLLTGIPTNQAPRRWTILFDPAHFDPTAPDSRSGFSTGPDHDVNHDVLRNPGVLLRNGKVLFVGASNQAADAYHAEVFDPDGDGGKGSWAQADTCSDNGQCFILTALNDGRVLAHGASYYNDRLDGPISGPPKLYLFDEQSGHWIRTGDMIKATTPGGAAVIAGAACDPPAKPYCGKVIAAGKKTSELYSPPG